MQLQQLKVKCKSLAEESRIIRKEEERALRRAHFQRRQGNEPYFSGTEGFRTYYSLYIHRKIDVGQEYRSAHLAYGFLRGTAYNKIEEKTKETNRPNFSRVWSIAKKFGGPFKNAEEESQFRDKFDAWIKTT